MNPTTDQLPPPPPPPALPLQPPRSSFSCDRHPDENFTGFCPSCLCERLHTLDQSAAAASSSSRRNSTSSSTAAAIKAIFRVPSSSNTTFEAYRNKSTAATGPTSKASFFPELRRTKSFSASKNDGLLGLSAGGFEPQRRSCDVRNTLWSLFSIDDENKPRLSSAQQQALGNTGTVLETNKEDEEEEEEEEEENQNTQVSEEQQEVRNVNDSDNNNDIVEEVAEIEQEQVEEDAIFDDLKTMKDHIDLDSQSKKPSLSNLWSAASVLSKKWQKWRRKQKKSTDDCNGVLSSSTLPVPKAISRKYRETQSEIADYGFGRRSCDVDPRFSLDAGRISFDDPRYSFDEPRASWDGYMIGRTFPRLPPMVEDVPVVQVQVPRSDMQISVEQPVADDTVPGGSIQTREYYSDSSSKRRKSLDRSNSIRKMAAAVVAEMDETKAAATTTTATTTAPVSNAKVSPATIDYNYNPGGLRFPSIGGERELARDSNSNSLRDDCSETFELGFRENGVVEKKEGKKGRRWRWKLWGFIQRRGGGKEEEDDGFSRVNVVERSYSEREGVTGNRRVFRSNSSVSWRNKFNQETNGFGNGKNRRAGGDEFVLERNRSARYSPNHADSGLLRFYLTPLRGSRRSGIGIGNGKTRPSSNNGKTLLKPGEGGWKVKP